jgi:DNA-binding NarL/FixJ family response regulator
MSILIADDEKRDRTWLGDLLTRDLASAGPVYEAGDGEEAIAQAQKHKPELIFLDIKMPKLSGIKAAEQILQASPKTGIIILSNFSDEIYVRQLWKIVPSDGAFGYLLKNASDSQVIEAASAVLSGDCWIHPGIARVIQRTQNRATNLTAAEYEALVLIALGFTDHAIAKKLYLTEKAVQSRLKSLYTKLAIPGRTEGLDTEFNQRCRAVHTATKRGLINQSELEDWEAKLLEAQKTLAILFLCLTFALATCFAPKALAEQKSSTHLSAHIQISRISPPTAGVRLLEDILSRIGNMSQVALSANNLKYDAKMDQVESGRTNSLLAIKPKQPQATEFNKIELDLSPSPAASAQPVFNKRSHVVSYERAALKGPRELQIVDERPEVQDFRTAPNQGSGADFYNKGSQSLNEQSKSSLSKSTAKGKVQGKVAGGKLSSTPLAKVNINQPPMLVTAGANIATSAPSPAPTRSMHIAPADLIASLPANVATGVALVQLGSTEQETVKSIAHQGDINREVVGSWTVLSVHKAKASKQYEKNTTMQIFMHRGIVEALRIYDPTLIKSEMGVRLGDDLKSVKGRFGEPSMILPEESPGAGQNYIYPMNQVGFLLARSAPEAEPQVVSLLIFKVK